MAKSKKKRSDKKKKAVGIILFFVALVIIVAMVTHNNVDDARLTGEIDKHLNPFKINYNNQAGLLGVFISFYLLKTIGWLAFFIPLGLIVASLKAFKSEIASKFGFSSLSLFLVALLGTMIYNIHILVLRSLSLQTESIGGYVSDRLTFYSIKIFGETGSYIILSCFVLLVILFSTSFSFNLSKSISMDFFKKTGSLFSSLFGVLVKALSFRWLPSLFEGDDEVPDKSLMETDDMPSQKEKKQSLKDKLSFKKSEEKLDSKPILKIKSKESQQKQTQTKHTKVKPIEQLQLKSVKYSYPPMEFLKDNPNSDSSINKSELDFTARMLLETLETFGVRVDGEIKKYPGPIITRFEFKPASGIKVNQILNLSDDLALALKAKRIRIIAPIPGKAAVGVEIPNRDPQMVYLKEIINNSQFKDSKIKLPLALGKTTAGHPYIIDLAKLPHLLVAGATGSGKSVCLNALITSLIYRLHPYQVRFIMIDPKMLELSVYKGIPHLGRQVVTNPKRAEKVFADAVVEMEKRYRKLANASVRSIDDYNSKQENDEDKLPYIIIFVDELADLMMSTNSSKTELLITRLAQMARAVGIHLVLATQRPSVDVITGLIKANFPARIAFQVSSKVDSRTIIDGNGAEKLLGNGDMLFLATGQPEPIRVHGAFLSNEETEKIVEFINDQGLEMMALEGISQKTGEVTETEIDTGDPLFREACDVVIRHKQGSVSLLQRRLGIGYQRAARLIDKLEQAGVVSTFDGSKAREVLVDEAYLKVLFAGGHEKPVTES